MSILLQINVEVNFGSTGRIAEEIGKLAIENGWKSYIAYGRHKRKSSSHIIRIGNGWDNNWHALQTRLFDRHAMASSKATKDLVDKIKEIKPSVVHLHNIHGYYINLKILIDYLSTTNIPVVHTLHDCWSLTGHCTHFEHVECNKWQSQCGKCPQKTVYPSSIGLDRSAQNHSLKKKVFKKLKNLTIVGVSEWLGNIVRKSHLKNRPIRIIPNGTDTNTFKPNPNQQLAKKYGLENRFVILGVASVWSKNKGFEDFIELGRLLKKDETIVLIGLNQKQLRNLPKNIIGLKRTESLEELASWYSTADVYVNTSVEESFGLTTAESLACGTPAIVYDTTACPEMIVPEVGIVVSKKNIPLLYDSIAEIKQNGKEYYTKASVERARKLYDKNKRYKEYIDLYKELTTIDSEKPRKFKYKT